METYIDYTDDPTGCQLICIHFHQSLSFTQDAFPATNLQVYPGLRQALECKPHGLLVVLYTCT